MSVANQAQFAIVLLGADDYCASRIQYEALNVADKALQFRARQNVILELGFFYGRLGWEKVFVLYQTPDRVFPNFERPSDLDGVVFVSLADQAWKRKLGAKLSSAGVKLTVATA
jgi:predicted nucleotide-binding protein